MQLLLLKSNDGAYTEWCREVKGNMYDMVVEGFQLLSRWTARIWEQSAWKFSRPCRDAAETQEASGSYSDYEKVILVKYLDTFSFMVTSFIFFLIGGEVQLHCRRKESLGRTCWLYKECRINAAAL